MHINDNIFFYGNRVKRLQKKKIGTHSTAFSLALVIGYSLFLIAILIILLNK